MEEKGEKGIPSFQVDWPLKEGNVSLSQDNHDRVALDPRVINAGFDLTGYYVESGRRSFTDYAQKMIEEYGHNVRPYLKSWYLAVRYYPGVDSTGMDNAARVDELMAFEDGYN